MRVFVFACMFVLFLQGQKGTLVILILFKFRDFEEISFSLESICILKGKCIKKIKIINKECFPPTLPLICIQ